MKADYFAVFFYFRLVSKHLWNVRPLICIAGDECTDWPRYFFAQISLFWFCFFPSVFIIPTQRKKKKISSHFKTLIILCVCVLCVDKLDFGLLKFSFIFFNKLPISRVLFLLLFCYKKKNRRLWLLIWFL